MSNYGRGFPEAHMKTIGFAATITVALALAGTTYAQVADHLKCYKVKDPQPKASYTADLGGLIAEPGCLIKVPATMACVPATKTNVQPPPPGGGATGEPNAFGCYKVKCPKAVLPLLQLNDQFGSRNVEPVMAKLICAPAASPTMSTTTTSATSTSTTTTSLLYTCSAAGGSQCGGTCPPSYSCTDLGGTCGCLNGTSCGGVSGAPACNNPDNCPAPGRCVDYPTLAGAACVCAD
jgi:hypothetical protein